MCASPGDELLEETATQAFFARTLWLREAIQTSFEEARCAEGDSADDLREEDSELLVLFDRGASEEVKVL